MARALYTKAGATMAKGPGAERSRRLVAWRRRLEGRRRVHDLEIPLSEASGGAGGAGGAEMQTYVLAAPADPDGVLDEAVADGGGDWHMPYWATPWASGLFLAETVLARPEALRGRRVLELGCGLGTTAIGAVLAQGRVGGGEGGVQPARWVGEFIAADVFAETLAYCRYNALRNTGRVVRTLLADWRTAGGQEALIRAGPFDLVLAADVLYEPEDVAPLLELGPRLVGAGGGEGGLKPARWAGGGELWLAEPGRATSARFVEAAAERGWVRGMVEAEREWPAGAGRARVRLHFLRPTGRPAGAPPGS